MEKGDTLSGIEVKFGVPVWKIVYDNQLKDKNQIVPGQALLLLKVDEGQAEESTQPELAKGKTVGGYAYPFIDKEILEQSFPALKELLVFSYGFTFEGNLVPPLQDDLWMIETAWRHGAKPIMVLTPFSEGAFNNQLVKVLTETCPARKGDGRIGTGTCLCLLFCRRRKDQSTAVLPEDLRTGICADLPAVQLFPIP